PPPSATVPYPLSLHDALPILPFPVFHYIDGAADDEATKARNSAAFDDVDLVPRVLAGVESIDTSVTVLGRKSALPLMLSPTALQDRKSTRLNSSHVKISYAVF